MPGIPDPLFAARVKLAVEGRLFGVAHEPLRVGRFEVMHRLGAGSMSIVYAARDLGRALERTGQREAACASYRRVLDRWGHAKPRSVTADDARARLARLGCAPR